VSRDLSKAMPRIINLSLYFFFISESSGMPFRQGSHQVAQQSMSMTLPLNSFDLYFVLVMSVNSNLRTFFLPNSCREDWTPPSCPCTSMSRVHKHRIVAVTRS